DELTEAHGHRAPDTRCASSQRSVSRKVNPSTTTFIPFSPSPFGHQLLKRDVQTSAEAAKPLFPRSTSEQSSTARPLVLRAEHVHRNLGRVGIRGNLVIEKVFRCLFDLD